MKLAKLSLAAIVAAGALTTVSAQPLEEAIKGVQFSGFLQYTLNDVEAENNTRTSTNDYDFLAKFTAPVADNLKAVMAFASGPDHKNNTGSIDAQGVDLAKAFFVYTNAGATVKAGLMALGTPVTDNGFNGSKGNGVLAMYNAGPVTLAGAYFGSAKMNLGTHDGDFAAAAVIGSFGPVAAQVWAIRAPGLIDQHIFAQVSAGYEGFSLVGQMADTELESGLDGTFYAVKGSFKMGDYGISATYTDNDEDQPIHAIDNSGDTDVIASGWRLQNTETTNDILESWGVDASATFGQFGVVAGIANAEFAADEADEVYAGVSYAYSKNFTTYVRYSDVDNDVAGEDYQYLRFNAAYKF